MPLHVHLLEKCNHMYKYVKTVLNFPVHIKTPSGGWYNSVYTLWEQRSTYKHSPYFKYKSKLFCKCWNISKLQI